MSNRKIICLFLIFCFFNFIHGADENFEVSCNINVKKAIQCVSEKFLSITVDPAVLLAGVNLSENSLRLAKHLHPAYIRIAGPSTRLVKYVDQDDKSNKLLSEDGNSVKITPAIWFGVTEWLKLTKLMPVFGINDADTTRGLWNPKSTLPLFEISENLNVSCYWQLGFDSSDKNETRYKQDINIFHYILTAYGARNDTWKIIGSDISALPADRVESIMIDDSDILEAVMWEPSGRELETFPERDVAYKILLHQSVKPRTKIWTTVPKSKEPVSFASTLLWAKQVGNAAKMGYDVIFRQPRIHELFTTTPIYWFSLLHKELMGCHVLDTKSTIFQEETDIFAHCTRKQNSFLRRGALTVLIVNDRPIKYKVKVKLGNSLPEKSMEIQMYILTSNSKNSTDLYLNGKLLTPNLLQDKNSFQPKVRRTKTSSYILLSLPPLSIGFFVLPGARIPVCVEKEIETQLLLEEIEENQNNGLSEEIALMLGSRASFGKNNLLDEITQSLKDEMKSDEKYYKRASKQLELNLFKDESIKADPKIDEKGRKSFIKFAEKHKKKGDGLRKFFLDKSKAIKTDASIQKPKSMDLTSEEMEKILKDRAVERAAKKNIVFTDEELEALIRKASKNFGVPKNKDKRAINMELLEKYNQETNQNLDIDQEPLKQDIKLRGKRDIHKKHGRGSRGINFNLLDLKSKIAEHKKLWQDRKDDLLGNSNIVKENIQSKIRELKSKLRVRRDINMDGLKKGTKSKKSKKVKTTDPDNEEIEATIRKPGQTSAELLEELKELENDDIEEEVPGEIYAELADSEDLESLEDDLILSSPPKPIKLGLFEKKPKIDPFAVVQSTNEHSRMKNKKKKSKSDEKLQFLTTSEEFTDIEDDLPSIHEYYGPKSKTGKKKDSGRERAQEINEHYDIPRLFKRDLEKFPPLELSHSKRGSGFTFIELAKFEDDVQPEDMLRDLFFNPLVKLPLLEQFYKYQPPLEKRIEDNSNIKLKINGLKKPTPILTSFSTKDNQDPLPSESKSIVEMIKKKNENLEILSPTEDISNQLTEDGLKKISPIEDVSNQLTEDGLNTKQDEDNVHDDNENSFKQQIDNLLDENEQFDQIEDMKSDDENGNTFKHQNYNMQNNQIEDPQNLDTASNIYSNEESENKQKYDDLVEEDISQDSSLSKHLDILDNPMDLPLFDVIEPAQILRSKRDLTALESSEEKPKKHKKVDVKKPIKKTKQASTKMEGQKKITKQKQKVDTHLVEQLNIILDKLQERKEEIDKMLKKQRVTENCIKDQWKNKLDKKKKSVKTEKGSKRLKKRSIFNPVNYQPVTTNLRMWKPSDISSLNRHINFSKKMVPPNDYPIFKNIFNNINRRKRFLDTDVNPLENEVDGYINEIRKEHFDENNFKEDKNDKLKKIVQEYKVENVVPKPDMTTQKYYKEAIEDINEYKDSVAIKTPDQDISKINENITIEDLNNITDSKTHKSFIKDGDYKFKLPNNDEFEIVKTGDDTVINFMHHDHTLINDFDEKIEEMIKQDDKTFIPKITPRTIKPFEGIEEFFGNIKKLFDKVGKEVKYYFNNIGLPM